MKTIYLIRHAKSSWKYPELDDHERPLNKRGERDSITIARYFQSCEWQSQTGEFAGFDVIYSSTATRALDLAQTISDFCHTSLVPDLSFYTFDADELLEILRNLPDHANCVAIVAHNPAITQVVNRLTVSQIANVPTAGVASIDCPLDSWHELDDGLCDLVSFITPKMLNG